MRREKLKTAKSVMASKKIPKRENKEQQKREGETMRPARMRGWGGRGDGEMRVQYMCAPVGACACERMFGSERESETGKEEKEEEEGNERTMEVWGSRIELYWIAQ